MNNQLTVVQTELNEIYERAKLNGTTPLKQAVFENSRLVNTPSLWGDLISISDEVDHYSKVKLMSGNECFFSQFCMAISGAILYPSSSAFLHGLGVLASSMMKKFKFDYYEETKPVNLYVVTAQPPSSGKSGLNNMLVNPIRKEFERINDENAFERRRLTKNLAQIEKDLDKETNDNAIKELQARQKLDAEKLKKVAFYKHSIDDGTAEAIERVAGRQDGYFSLISAEATTIEILLGAIYGGGKSNLSMYLKGWDAEYCSIERAGRETNDAWYCGCLAVAGQSKSIEEIMRAGESGQGVNERMLMLREKPMIGYRDFSKRKPVPKEMKDSYEQLIKNIINSDVVKLTLSEESQEFMNNYRQNMEYDLRPNGKFGNSMIVGFIGKADKQIVKIAAVLHVATDWLEGGQRRSQIDDDVLLRAVGIFSALIESYIDSAHSEGYAKDTAQLEAIASKLDDAHQKGKVKITLRDLRDKIRNLKAFKGVDVLTDKLRNELLPELEERNFIAFDGESNIYINPKL
ncbi:hypothetical protein CL622_04415 [archaeon]|nr:hypothetical protein [archaeon]